MTVRLTALNIAVAQAVGLGASIHAVEDANHRKGVSAVADEKDLTLSLLAGLWNRERVNGGARHTCYREVFQWHAAEIRRAKAEAWEGGWEAAIDQAPGDVWFDEWHYQSNPYRTERTTDEH